MKKLLAGILTLAIVTLAGCIQNADAGNAAGNEGTPLEQAAGWDQITIATLGDTSLTLTELLYFINTDQIATEQQMISQGVYTEENIGEYWLYSEEGGPTMGEMLKAQSLTSALHFASLYKLAEEAGTQVEESVLEEGALAVDNATSALDENPALAAEEFLAQYGVTPTQMKDILRRMDVINQYLYEVSVNASISPEQIEAAYDANPDAYDMVTVRHVLIMSGDTMTEEEQAAAKTKAEDILAQLQGGADIGQLAAEYSEDPGSKDNNGEYTFGKGQMVAAFEDWSFSAAPGDTGIVKSDYGYHVMLMIEKLGFDSARETIREDLANDEANKVIEAAMATAENDWTIDEEAWEDVVVG
jgi:foldase protein PrsA